MNKIIQQDLARIVSANLPWEQFSGASILITGAAGFLPAYMVETLLYLNRNVLDKPCQIVAQVRDRKRFLSRFGHYIGDSNLAVHVRDVSEPVSWGLGTFDYVIHAASQASPVYYSSDPVGTLLANTVGTVNLLNLARSGCKGFLYFSSGEVYGVVPDPTIPTSESFTGGSLDPLNIRSCYGESKRMGEQMCVAWAHQYGIPTKIVRPWHTYGPGMKLNDGRVFADFTRDILAGGPIVLNSTGEAKRSFCYLADATIAFFMVLLKGEVARAYNVANPDAEVSIASLANMLAVSHDVDLDWRGKPAANYVPSPSLGTRADITKIRALGWEPTTGIEQGFARTVESYG